MTDTTKPAEAARTARTTREFYVPVFCLKTRKLVVFRQQATDTNSACIAARRRFPHERVLRPFDHKPTAEELAPLDNLSHLPQRERRRFVRITGE